MSQSAFQIQYRQEYIAAFEQHQSLLRGSTTNEAVIKGNQATFLVAGSGNAIAVTRGLNGQIPQRTDDLTQPSATLVEWHDLPTRTHFNIFASQGDGRRIMQMTSQAVINRRVDQDVINELANATQNMGAATTGSVELLQKAQVLLLQQKVPFDGDITAVITPAFMGYLLRDAAFTNSLYTPGNNLSNDAATWADKVMTLKQLRLNIIVSPQLTGMGTNTELCYMYHKNAMGHAMDVENMQVIAGYNEEQDYYYSRASVFAGAKILQNTGIVQMVHDGSAFTFA